VTSVIGGVLVAKIIIYQVRNVDVATWIAVCLIKNAIREAVGMIVFARYTIYVMNVKYVISISMNATTNHTIARVVVVYVYFVKNNNIEKLIKTISCKLYSDLSYSNNYYI
jgi:hypothetical protein